MKKYFSAEETVEMVLKLLSTSELQDSSGEDTSFYRKSDKKCSLESCTSVSVSDLSSESGEGTEDLAHSEYEWTAGGCSSRSFLLSEKRSEALTEVKDFI